MVFNFCKVQIAPIDLDPMADKKFFPKIFADRFGMDVRRAHLNQNSYKCKTLKDLIQKSEIFDVVDEPTPKGGRRATYRFKDGWKLELHPTDEISNHLGRPL
jgi:hypothetical protein